MLRDAGEAANVGEEHGDRVCVTPPSLKEFGFSSICLTTYSGREAAVVGAGHFLLRQAFVRSHIFDCDGRLRRDRANQLQIVGLEGREGIETIRIERSMDP